MKAAQSCAETVEQLIEVGRMAVDRGLVLASGGNLSARIPGEQSFFITSGGAWLDRLTPTDFSQVDLAGTVIGGAEKPSSEWKLHQRTYQVRPDVNAVVHVHPQYAILVDALAHPIRMFSLDHAYYVKSVGVTPYYPNGSDELADTAAEQARHHNCVLMSNHGCSAMGEDIGMAFRRAMNLEEAAMATYRALTVGDTTSTFPVAAYQQLHHA